MIVAMWTNNGIILLNSKADYYNIWPQYRYDIWGRTELTSLWMSGISSFMFDLDFMSYCDTNKHMFVQLYNYSLNIARADFNKGN